MAQTKQEQEKNQPNQESNQPQMEANEQTQTPPARQAGANQPQGNYGGGQQQGITRSGFSGQNRGLSRREPYASPFSFMRRFSEEMDRLFDDFGFGGSLISPRGFGREFENAMWSPQTEIFERGNELVVRADLPGMTKDDINVDIEDDQIIIRGERRDERQTTEEGFYHSERSYGSFYRSIPLPQGIDAEKANAAFNNGVLEITVPKPEQKTRGRRIEIGEGGGNKNQTGKQTTGGETKSENQ